MDRRLIEAATDLYAGRVQAFLRVTVPLALPGIFAGTLLTFIPALGDFINAQLLGSLAPVHDRQRHPVAVPRRCATTRWPRRCRSCSWRSSSSASRSTRGCWARARCGSPSHEDAGRPAAHLGAGRLGGPGPRLPVPADRGSSRCTRSTTPRGASTSPGRASRSTTGSTRSRSRACSEALTNSLVIGALATVIAVALGTLMALALVRHRYRGRGGDGGARVPAAGHARGGHRRGAARAVPDDEPRPRLRDDPDRARHVHARLRRRDDPRAPGGHGPAHRGGRDGPRVPTSGRRCAR